MKLRLIYNDDTCTLRTVPPPHTVEHIAHALNYLKGTQVDCLCWCLCEQIAFAWPSTVIENFFDLQARGAAPISGWGGNGDVMYSLHREGIDYLPLLIQGAHEQGLTFIGSFRMNDTHIKSYPNSILAPDFWKLNQAYRLWGVTDGKSYYNAALDYSYAEVRDRYKNTIAEVAGQYDIDGVELDFTRSPYFFQPDEAWGKREILTNFVHEVRDLLAEAEARRGRELTLILRIPCAERALRIAGIDARRWITEKLGPILVISELSNNFNQEIGEWSKLCHDAGVLLYPAVEAGPAIMRADFYSTQLRNPLAPRHDNSDAGPLPIEKDLAMQRAAAQNLLSQAPDGLYVFNFPCRLAEGDNILHTDAERMKHVTGVLNEMGSLDTLAGREKHYTFYPDLPLYVEAGRPRHYHQTIAFTLHGEDIRQAQVALRFRQIAERNPHAEGDYVQNPFVESGVLRYYLNDNEIDAARLQKSKAPAGRIPSGFLLGDHEVIEIVMEGQELRPGKNTLSFEMPSVLPHERDPYVYIYELEAHVSFC